MLNRRRICSFLHSHVYVPVDKREETIDLILGNEKVEPFWYCSKCDLKFYDKNHTYDNVPR